MMTTMLGQFLELSVTTQDIGASVEFYERLGFTHCRTSDTWPHPYGVLTDGRLFIGLHEYRFSSPAITTVRPGIAGLAHQFTDLGIKLAFAKTSEDSFNEIGFRDPAGQMLTILEARTFFPTDRRPTDISRCGYFTEFSIPCADFGPESEFWERLGFVAHEPEDTPYLRQSITGNGLSVGLHRPRTLDRPMLVFIDADMAQRIESLRELGLLSSETLPRGLDPQANALIESPDGTALLLLTGES